MVGKTQQEKNVIGLHIHFKARASSKVSSGQNRHAHLRAMYFSSGINALPNSRHVKDLRTGKNTTPTGKNVIKCHSPAGAFPQDASCNQFVTIFCDSKVAAKYQVAKILYTHVFASFTRFQVSMRDRTLVASRICAQGETRRLQQRMSSRVISQMRRFQKTRLVISLSQSFAIQR